MQLRLELQRAGRAAVHRPQQPHHAGQLQQRDREAGDEDQHRQPPQPRPGEVDDAAEHRVGSRRRQLDGQRHRQQVGGEVEDQPGPDQGGGQRQAVGRARLQPGVAARAVAAARGDRQHQRAGLARHRRPGGGRRLGQQRAPHRRLVDQRAGQQCGHRRGGHEQRAGADLQVEQSVQPAIGDEDAEEHYLRHRPDPQRLRDAERRPPARRAVAEMDRAQHHRQQGEAQQRQDQHEHQHRDRRQRPMLLPEQMHARGDVAGARAGEQLDTVERQEIGRDQQDEGGQRQCRRRTHRGAAPPLQFAVAAPAPRRLATHQYRQVLDHAATGTGDDPRAAHASGGASSARAVR